jgi:hypothetical protein
MGGDEPGTAADQRPLVITSMAKSAASIKNCLREAGFGTYLNSLLISASAARMHEMSK